MTLKVCRMNESTKAYLDHAAPASTGVPSSADQPPLLASDEDDADLTLPVDPTELPPFGTEEEFAAELADLVAGERPRLFALCEEIGDRVDGWVVAWGLAFEDQAEVIGTDDGIRATCRSAETALRMLGRRRRLRLLWSDPKRPERDGPPDEPTIQQVAS